MILAVKLNYILTQIFLATAAPKPKVTKKVAKKAAPKKAAKKVVKKAAPKKVGSEPPPPPPGADAENYEALRKLSLIHI